MEKVEESHYSGLLCTKDLQPPYYSVATASRRQFSPRPSLTLAHEPRHPPLVQPCNSIPLFTVYEAMIRATFRRWRLLNGQLKMYVMKYTMRNAAATLVSRADVFSRIPVVMGNITYCTHKFPLPKNVHLVLQAYHIGMTSVLR